MPLMKDTEREYEYRVVGIQLLHSVIAAFINVYDEVTVSRQSMQRFYPINGLNLFAALKKRKLHESHLPLGRQ
ncbi:Uncharacterised protein [Pseudomonas fluorescens]|uniref:Uncharacterized protein n=1 Tax=Pseudomonas fluorescens TaxID=294 RepID=A0A3S4NQ33_PSEFL|nr:Uncharacterised protein [Pseudomonas fluorescens]